MIKEAVVQKFEKICKEKQISYTELARRSGVTPSTVYSMLKPERRDLSIITIKKLCDGLDISLAEFFSDPLFVNIAQELQ